MRRKSLTFFWISIAVYVISFFLPAFYEFGENPLDNSSPRYWIGISVFLAGGLFLPFFFVNWWVLLWLANPLYWKGLSDYWHHKDGGVFYVISSFILGLLFLTTYKSSFQSNLDSVHVVGQVGLGYYLWMMSFVLLFVAMYMDPELCE